MKRQDLLNQITDASYRQFSVTKWDILDKNSPEKKPEKLVMIMINAWMNSIVNIEKQDQKDKWKKYPLYFASEIVMKNSIFPGSLPIGYVIKCFFINVYVETASLAIVKEKFNSFILSNDNRVKMFEAFKKGEFYKTGERVELDKELDGMKLAKLLYKSSTVDSESKAPEPALNTDKKETQTTLL